MRQRLKQLLADEWPIALPIAAILAWIAALNPAFALFLVAVLVPLCAVFWLLTGEVFDYVIERLYKRSLARLERKQQRLAAKYDKSRSP